MNFSSTFEKYWKNIKYSGMPEKTQNILNEAKNYNFWEGKLFQAGFERQEYLSNIKNYLGNKLVKVLVGQRRVGKSYILRQIMNFLVSEEKIAPQNIFYLNKEYTAFDEIKSASELESLFTLYLKEWPLQGKIYIFLDEVQNIKGWEKFVNSYSQDFTTEYELFITGSNSNLLSGELSTLLSGRFVEFEILPFSFSEFVSFKKLGENKESFLEYLKTSGLPELFFIEKQDIKRHYIDSLKNTIILRDIAGRHTIKDLPLLEEIFKFVTVNIGNLTSFSSVVKYFKSKQKKTNYETISAYVGYLRDTFIFHQVERFQLRGKQSLGGEYKYYLNDLGFKNYLFGFYPSDIGYNLENQIYIQLKRMGFQVSVGKLNNLEIDFVAQKPEKTIYVQVAYLLNSQAVVEREFGNLLSIKDNHEKLVISLDDVHFSDYKGIKHLFPWELKL